MAGADGVTQTVVYIGSTDGSTTLLAPNENGVVQFPESGNGFERYTNNDYDEKLIHKYSYFLL